KVAPGQEPQPAKADLVFPQGTKNYYLPRALAPISSRGDGKLDFAAVALRFQPKEGTQPPSYRLQLVSLKDSGRVSVDESAPLLRVGGEEDPIVATAPRGQYVAVGGRADHSILIYHIASLLARRGQPQLLHSVGDAPEYASFLRKGENDVGLLLSKQAKE